jgi:hypothetical protein
MVTLLAILIVKPLGLNDSTIKITKRMTKKYSSLLPSLVRPLSSRSTRSFHPSSIRMNCSSLVRSSVGGLQYLYNHQWLLYQLSVCIFLWAPETYISPLSSGNHTFPFTSYCHSFTITLQQLSILLNTKFYLSLLQKIARNLHSSLARSHHPILFKHNLSN